MSSIDELRIPREQAQEIHERFRRTGALTGRKLIEYIPAMLMTNISTLLSVTVDGLVVGNLVGEYALSAVNVFYPASLLISVVYMLILNGSAACLSNCMGRNDIETLRSTKQATKIFTIVSALATSLVQIPIVLAMINSYGLSPEMYDATLMYAIGVMIGTPFTIISQTGVAQLQTLGKMKPLMALAVTESVLNLVFDIIYVGPMGLGIIGAGLGTATAAIIRCIGTVVYISKKTDMYKTEGAKAHASDFKEILSCGLPEAANILMLAVQNYLLMQVVIDVFGDSDGGVIKGVCVFCFGISFVVIGGVQGAMRPLAGLIIGCKDWVGLRILVKQCVRIVTIAVGVMTVVVIAIPDLFFYLHGVDVVPEAGALSLQLFSLHFIIKGLNTLFRLYFATRRDSLFATVVTVVGNGLLPLFAWVFSMVLPPAFVWLSYAVSELVALVAYLLRYKRVVITDKQDEDPDAKILSLTVAPDEAVEASREIRRYAQEQGFSERVAYRAALCMEEMVAYAVKSQTKRDIQIQILVRFDKEGCVFMMLDDGDCIALDEDKGHHELITNNYELLKKIAKSVNYQYVLNMNHTVMTF